MNDKAYRELLADRAGLVDECKQLSRLMSNELLADDVFDALRDERDFLLAAIAEIDAAIAADPVLS